MSGVPVKIIDRYSTAIHTSNLKSDATTTWADIDVIGAAGIAGKYTPLGVGLARMLAGGGRGEVVAILSNMVFKRRLKHDIKITYVQAEDIAKAVLAWWRDGTCQPCGGRGSTKIKDAPSLGDECKHCQGTGKIPFDRQFRSDWLPLARWLSAEIERSQAVAGVLAMKIIAPTLDIC